MADSFFFLGFDDAGWFDRNFEPFHLFGYVGDRDRLMASMTKKSIWRQVIEVFAPRLNLATIVNALAQYPLLKVDPEKTLAHEVIKILTSEENRRTLTQLLEVTYKLNLKKGRYFDRVARPGRAPAVCDADFKKLQDQLITVEAQLIHRDAVQQYNTAAAATLRSSSEEWLLSDFPPPGLVRGNDRFSGKFLLLREDPGFSDVFAETLPFARDIGWYPYVRITGYFDASRLSTERHPCMSISLVEYRRPRMITEVQDDALQFLEGELSGRNRLSDWSNLVLFAYLFPLLFNASNLKPSEADADVSVLLKRYISVVGADLPKSVNAYYAALP